MENDNFASLTREQLFKELRVALEGKYEEMSPVRACQFADRCNKIIIALSTRILAGLHNTGHDDPKVAITW